MRVLCDDHRHTKTTCKSEVQVHPLQWVLVFSIVYVLQILAMATALNKKTISSKKENGKSKQAKALS